MTDTDSDDSDVAELQHFISTGDWRVPSSGRAGMPQLSLCSDVRTTLAETRWNPW